MPGRNRRGGGLWLTVYSDFVTNMVLFFLVLYSSTRVTHEEQEGLLRNLQETMSGAPGTAIAIEVEAGRRIEEMMTDQKLEEFVMVDIDEKTIRIVLREGITFQPGDDRLMPEGYPVLDEIIDIVRDLPNDIIIEGHTDNIPITRSRRFFSNWELSGARALSVLGYMERSGIDPERLSAIGHGEYRPVFSNETEEGRAMNRRVEISIVRL